VTLTRKPFLLACAAAAGFCLWIFHQPLLHGGVADFNYGLPAPEKAVRFGAEGRYMVQSSYFTLNRLVRAGHLPLWTPFSGGGTPMLGKMLPGAFTPINIPYYLVGPDNLPAMFMLTSVLKFTLGLLFCFLLGRVIGLDGPAAAFAGLYFISGYWFYTFKFYGIPSSALFLPLLLLLGELYLRGHRRSTLLLLPWAAGLPFYGAHFETAVLANAAAAIYFTTRVWHQPRLNGKLNLRPIWEYAAAAACGAIIAAPSLLAVSEYVAHSYTRVWRSQPGFGWHYHTIGKHLTSSDTLMTLLGWGGLFLGAWCLRRFTLSSTTTPLKRTGWPIAAAAACAVALGALANVGLDLSLRNLITRGTVPATWVWVLNLGLLAMALWGLARSKNISLKILGGLFLGVIAIRLKLPPLTYLMVHLPIFSKFNNADYHYIYDVAAGLLTGAALMELRALAQLDWSARRQALLSAAVVLWTCTAAFSAAPHVERFLALRISTGIHPKARLPGAPPGGVMGPEKLKTFQRRRLITGWIPGSETTVLIDAGSADGAKTVPPVKGRITSKSSRRQHFAIDVPLPEAGQPKMVVRIVHPNGSSRYLAGPQMEIHRYGKSPWAAKIIIGFLILIPLLLLMPSAGALPLTGILALLVCAAVQPLPSTESKNIPYKLPLLNSLAEKDGRWRVFSHRGDLLHADAANLYGLSDLRSGGDNLDVHPMVEFERLVRHLLSQADPKVRDSALRLLGLANVRYLIDFPDANRQDKALKEAGRDKALSAFENAHIRPRVSFFSQATALPVTAEMLMDGPTRDRILGSLAAGLTSGQIDPLKTLLLNDNASTPPPGAPAPHSGGGPKIEVEHYTPQYVRVKVDVPSGGYLFLADNHYPGWQAYVQGEKTQTLRSWLTFRAVRVAPGLSTVEFKYEPFAITSTLVLSSLLALLWIYLFLRPTPPPQHQSREKKSKKELRAQEEHALAVAEQNGNTHKEVVLQAARWSEGLCATLVGSSLLFWSAWAGFIYVGSPLIRWPARLLLVIFVAVLGKRIASLLRTAQPQTDLAQ
jgi:hypothetical protein